MLGRWVVVVVLLLALVIAAGVAVYRWNPIREALDKNAWDYDPAMPPLPPPFQGLPKLEIDERTHDFGDVEQGAKLAHEFVFKNEGTYPLTLVKGSTSCRCTISKLENDSIPPGESATIRLEWEPIGEGKQRQTATIFTNDATNRRVNLTITGNVVRTLKIEPSSWVLSSVDRSTPQTLEVTIQSTTRDDLEILSHEFERERIAEFFELEITKLEGDELPSDAKSAYRGVLTMKPGMPIGRFRQVLKIQTNLPDRDPISFYIDGTVVGDVSIVGRAWNVEQSLVQMGVVRSSIGAKQRLYLIVRGPHRDEVDFTVAEKTEGLVVDILEKEPLEGGTVVRIPIDLSIPRGTPTVDRWGALPGTLGYVKFDSHHPEVGEFMLYVQYAVEAS